MSRRARPGAVTVNTQRCAVYTRKSSEEGLDQAFNSLHAQREACEAYIKSQAGEGWSCLRSEYDDGGISGGTMDRPSLKRLLDDIERGLIDVVVVYKVDRLTRSLTDFAKIIDVFDRKGVSFVSVTQAFNTTNSMGRLTLNVLLSFAQFEREVTGERIRDKIAASKAKGMWMGGIPPLGYDIPDDRTTRALNVNPAEAAVVRDIYQRYLRLKSVNAVRNELARDGIGSKAWVSRAGRKVGGVQLTTGALFHILQSRIYVGEIVHGEHRHPGAHEPVIDLETFDAVQDQFAANARERRANPPATASLPLQGVLFDADGNRMGPSFAYSRGNRRYAYYVSLPVQKAIKLTPDAIGRISARPLEALVLARMRGLIAAAEAGWADVLPLIRRIDVGPSGLSISLDQQAVLAGRGDAAQSVLSSRLAIGDRVAFDTRNGHTLQLIIQVRPVFRGGRTWLVRPDGRAEASSEVQDRGLVRTLAQAHCGVADVNASPCRSAESWVGAEAIPDSYLRRLAGLAFLAPDIQRAILEGRHPAGLSACHMINQRVPLAWADQRRAFGFSA